MPTETEYFSQPLDIGLLGSSGAGKSSFLQQLTTNESHLDEYNGATSGEVLRNISLSVKEELVKLRVCAIHGMTQHTGFTILSPRFFRVVGIVVDLSKDDFNIQQDLEKFHVHAKENGMAADLPIFIIGNIIDRAGRDDAIERNKTEINGYLAKLPNTETRPVFLPASAKNRTDVSKVFESMAGAAIDFWCPKPNPNLWRIEAPKSNKTSAFFDNITTAIAPARELFATALFAGLASVVSGIKTGAIGEAAVLASPGVFDAFGILTVAQLISTNVQFFTDDKKKLISLDGFQHALQSIALGSSGAGAAVATGLIAAGPLVAPICFAGAFGISAAKNFIDAGRHFKKSEKKEAVKSLALGVANIALGVAVVLGLIFGHAAALAVGAAFALGLTGYLIYKAVHKPAKPEADSASQPLLG